MARKRKLVSLWKKGLILVLLILLFIPDEVIGVKPVFDLSNTMRFVMLPSDTKLGSVIYRLRASDADEDYPLMFTVYGE